VFAEGVETEEQLAFLRERAAIDFRDTFSVNRFRPATSRGCGGGTLYRCKSKSKIVD